MLSKRAWLGQTSIDAGWRWPAASRLIADGLAGHAGAYNGHGNSSEGQMWRGTPSTPTSIEQR